VIAAGPRALSLHLAGAGTRLLRPARLALLGLVAAAIAITLKPGGATLAAMAEELLAYFILFSIALSFFYNFVFHVFFRELAASFIVTQG